MNLRTQILELVMRRTYSRLEYAEQLTDEIIKLVDLWKQENKIKENDWNK